MLSWLTPTGIRSAISFSFSILQCHKAWFPSPSPKTMLFVFVRKLYAWLLLSYYLAKFLIEHEWNDAMHCWIHTAWLLSFALLCFHISCSFEIYFLSNSVFFLCLVRKCSNYSYNPTTELVTQLLLNIFNPTELVIQRVFIYCTLTNWGS